MSVTCRSSSDHVRSPAPAAPRTAALTLPMLLISNLCTTSAFGQNWPSFRGANASGIADGQHPPTKWDAAKSENVRWKTPIPGLGHSSPTVWGDRIFLTTAISGDPKASIKAGMYGNIESVNDDTTHTFHLLSLSKKSGEILWDRTVAESVPKVKRHTKSSHANPTCATDGKHVIAFFGSEGLYCYDFAGKQVWKKDLGVLDSAYYAVPDAQWAFGSSPIIHKGTVIVQCDVLKDPFIAAFDIEDGREIWRTARDDVPTWSTPTVYDGPGRPELVVNGYKHMGGYDPTTGKELWRMAGGSDIPVPTPVVAHNLAFFSSSHGMPQALYAIKLGADGDISIKKDQKPGESVAWFQAMRAAYMPTPIVYGDEFYVLGDMGILTTYDAKTGDQRYRERIGNGGLAFTASPVAADGHVYLQGEDGETFVVKAGPKFEIMATNSIGETTLATPAISEGMLLIRGQRTLFAIGEGR